MHRHLFLIDPHFRIREVPAHVAMLLYRGAVALDGLADTRLRLLRVVDHSDGFDFTCGYLSFGADGTWCGHPHDFALAICPPDEAPLWLVDYDTWPLDDISCTKVVRYLTNASIGGHDVQPFMLSYQLTARRPNIFLTPQRQADDSSATIVPFPARLRHRQSEFEATPA